MSRRSPNRRQGTFAEEVVAREYELEHRPGETEWYDCVAPGTGTKYEVKSTHRTVDGGATGRFRVWQDQHRSLTAAAAAEGQTAWYAFVLLDDADDVMAVQRRRPATVTKAVREENGSWNEAGHTERGDGQHKIPWPALVDR